MTPGLFQHFAADATEQRHSRADTDKRERPDTERGNARVGGNTLDGRGVLEQGLEQGDDRGRATGEDTFESVDNGGDDFESRH